MSNITNSRPIDNLLTEKLRPTDFGTRLCVLDRVKKCVANIKDPQTGALTTNLLLYSKTPGTGKTSITRILSNGCLKLELNASKERGIDVIRNDVVSFITSNSMTGNKQKVVVLEEMDGMTDSAFDALRATIEDAKDVRFIGNCNDINKIPEAIRSRFYCLPLEPLNVDEVEELMTSYKSYIGKLLSRLKIEYTDESLSEFVSANFPSMRNLVNEVDMMSKSGCTNLSDCVVKRVYSCESLFKMIFDNQGMSSSDVKISIYQCVMKDYATQASEVVYGFSEEFIDYVLSERHKYSDFIDVFAITIGEYMDQLTRTTNPKIVLMALVFSIYQIINQVN